MRIRPRISLPVAGTLFVALLGSCQPLARWVSEAQKQLPVELRIEPRSGGGAETHAPTNPVPNVSLPTWSGGTATTVPASQAVAAPDRIVIGSYNIQVLGTAKISNPSVAAVLVDLARQFDLLAIQELRAADETVIPQLVSWINANGARYNYVISPRLGNTSSKEQYVYLFNTDRVELVHPGFVVPDPNNLVHREPLASKFRARTNPAAAGFSFTIVNIHTDPDVVSSELNALADVYTWLRQLDPVEDDVIVAGDFNAGPRDFGRFGMVPGLVAAIPDHVATNTIRTRCLDNIVFDGAATREFTGQAGVVDVITRYNLSAEQARAVSDHLPVWATFTASESAAQWAQIPH